MKRLFEMKMGWKRVLIFAVVSALAAALLNCIPFLDGSSFTAPAETLELWIVLALVILINCGSTKEAVVKTFVFFLVSQPLCYLIEVPFKAEGWGLFRYYPYWGIYTLLTIPGAAVAYRVKKGDVPAALILSVANLLMIVTGMSRIGFVLYEFPRQLLSLLFCLLSPVLLILCLLKEKRSRTVGFLLAAAILIGSIFAYVIFPRDTELSYPLEEGSWTIEAVSGKGLSAYMEGEDRITLKSHRNGSYTILLSSENGETVRCTVTVGGAEHSMTISRS